LTDWGDCGHWQPLSVSYCAFVYAAALSWSVASAAAFNPVAAVDELFLRAPRCGAALILAELADIYLECGATCSNSTVLFNLLFKKGYMLPEGVTAARLRVIEEHLNSLSKRVTCVESARSAETAIVKQEIEQIIRLLHAAVVRGRTMLNGAAPAGREQLIWRKMMDEICSVQLELWLKRNRPGGVRDSLERINTAY